MAKLSSLISVGEFEGLLQRHEDERKNESSKSSEEKMKAFMVRMDEKFDAVLKWMGIDKSINELVAGEISTIPIETIDETVAQESAVVPRDKNLKLMHDSVLVKCEDFSDCGFLMSKDNNREARSTSDTSLNINSISPCKIEQVAYQVFEENPKRDFYLDLPCETSCTNVDEAEEKLETVKFKYPKLGRVDCLDFYDAGQKSITENAVGVGNCMNRHEFHEVAEDVLSIVPNGNWNSESLKATNAGASDRNGGNFSEINKMVESVMAFKETSEKNNSVHNLMDATGFTGVIFYDLGDTLEDFDTMKSWRNCKKLKVIVTIIEGHMNMVKSWVENATAFKGGTVQRSRIHGSKAIHDNSSPVFLSYKFANWNKSFSLEFKLEEGTGSMNFTDLKIDCLEFNAKEEVHDDNVLSSPVNNLELYGSHDLGMGKRVCLSWVEDICDHDGKNQCRFVSKQMLLEMNKWFLVERKSKDSVETHVKLMRLELASNQFLAAAKELWHNFSYDFNGCMSLGSNFDGFSKLELWQHYEKPESIAITIESNKKIGKSWVEYVWFGATSMTDYFRSSGSEVILDHFSYVLQNCSFCAMQSFAECFTSF